MRDGELYGVRTVWLLGSLAGRRTGHWKVWPPDDLMDQVVGWPIHIYIIPSIRVLGILESDFYTKLARKIELERPTF